MLQRVLLTIALILFEQQIQLAQAVTCARNPCSLVPGLYDVSSGYCCYDIAPNFADALCTCPNGIPSTINTPCRANAITTTTTLATQLTTCNQICVNGGVCNIVNGQSVCWCPLGFSGTNCEIQGIQNRCYNGLCQAGTCFERQIGTSIYAYCQCAPGYRGLTCNQCYFTCPTSGLFPDTAQCSIGRYFYCQQAGAVPVSALCPNNQRFNRFTNQCDRQYQCT